MDFSTIYLRSRHFASLFPPFTSLFPPFFVTPRTILLFTGDGLWTVIYKLMFISVRQLSCSRVFFISPVQTQRKRKQGTRQDASLSYRVIDPSIDTIQVRVRKYLLLDLLTRSTSIPFRNAQARHQQYEYGAQHRHEVIQHERCEATLGSQRRPNRRREEKIQRCEESISEIFGSIFIAGCLRSPGNEGSIHCYSRCRHR